MSVRPFGCQRTLSRFWSKVQKMPNGCWLWTKGCTPAGYGSFWAHGRRHHASRFILEECQGKELPPHIFACHHCDERRCVNPAHLFTGTQVENMRDMLNKGRFPVAARNTCSRGHPYDERNTAIRRRAGRTSRICRKCDCIRHAAYKSRTALP